MQPKLCKLHCYISANVNLNPPSSPMMLPVMIQLSYRLMFHVYTPIKLGRKEKKTLRLSAIITGAS